VVIFRVCSVFYPFSYYCPTSAKFGVDLSRWRSKNVQGGSQLWFVEGYYDKVGGLLAAY
jgi:hypothetical protein